MYYAIINQKKELISFENTENARSNLMIPLTEDEYRMMISSAALINGNTDLPSAVYKPNLAELKEGVTVL